MSEIIMILRLWVVYSICSLLHFCLWFELLMIKSAQKWILVSMSTVINDSLVQPILLSQKRVALLLITLETWIRLDSFRVLEKEIVQVLLCKTAIVKWWLVFVFKMWRFIHFTLALNEYHCRFTINIFPSLLLRSTINSQYLTIGLCWSGWCWFWHSLIKVAGIPYWTSRFVKNFFFDVAKIILSDLTFIVTLDLIATFYWSEKDVIIHNRLLT